MTPVGGMLPEGVSLPARERGSKHVDSAGCSA